MARLRSSSRPSIRCCTSILPVPDGSQNARGPRADFACGGLQAFDDRASDWLCLARRRPDPATSGAGCLGSLWLLDELALDRDLDLLAHHHPAVQQHVEAKAKISPVDLGSSAVGDPVSHHSRIVELPVPDHIEHHGVGGLLNGQVTGHFVMARSGRLDAGTPEGDLRVLVHLEEVRGAQVVVPDSVVGTDAGRRDGHLDRRRLRMIGIDIAGRADLIEITSYRHHPKMLGGELDLRVIRVELPVAHEGASLLPPDPDAAPNMPQCDRSPGPDVSGGPPPHTRPTSDVALEPDAPSSDGIAGRFGGVLPPGGRGPDDNRGFGLFHLPPRVLLEPVIVAALRPAVALTCPAARLE